MNPSLIVREVTQPLIFMSPARILPSGEPNVSLHTVEFRERAEQHERYAFHQNGASPRLELDAQTIAGFLSSRRKLTSPAVL